MKVVKIVNVSLEKENKNTKYPLIRLINTASMLSALK